MGIVRIGTAGIAAETGAPATERIVAGRPSFRSWNGYEDRSGVFFAGIWESGPGAWRIACTEDELCHLLEGEVVITEDAGQAQTFRAGDSFVVPAGFAGIWETRQHVRKLYAIHQPKG